MNTFELRESTIYNENKNINCLKNSEWVLFTDVIKNITENAIVNK